MRINMGYKGYSRQYFDKLQRVIQAMDLDALDQAIEVIKQAWLAGKQVIVFGNGGSAITAMHYITDWNKMIPETTGKPFRGRTLTDNMGLVTAYANDMSYADVFVEQLKNILQPNDLVIGISGSG